MGSTEFPSNQTYKSLSFFVLLFYCYYYYYWIGLSDFGMETNEQFLRNYVVTLAVNFPAICRFCFVAPLVNYGPLKYGLYISQGYNVVRSIKLHNRQTLLPIVWFTDISQSLTGFWTQKIMRLGLYKIMHAIRLFLLDYSSYSTAAFSCFLSSFFVKCFSSKFKGMILISYKYVFVITAIANCLLCGPPPQEGAAYCVALSVRLSVCPSVPLSLPLVTSFRPRQRHVAPPSELQ